MHEQQLNLPLGLPGSAPIWDAAVLETLAELNEQLLQRLCRLASLERPAPLLRALLPQWRALDAAACRALAQGPVLLLDAGLAEPARWHLLSASGVQDADVGPSGNLYFADGAGIALLRRVLVLAWHLARANPLAGRVALGMSGPCAMRLACCRLDELERLAEGRPEWIRPRWEARPDIWQPLLEAALQPERPALRHLRWRGVQLLAASLQAAEQEGGRGR
ncbi:MAG: hypothetical protein QM718_09355 [Steroidobacteraceae bacterium]